MQNSLKDIYLYINSIKSDFTGHLQDLDNSRTSVKLQAYTPGLKYGVLEVFKKKKN